MAGLGRERWRFRGSVFDAFAPAERGVRARREIRKVVVTLGTYRDFGFPLLIERLLELLPPEAEVLWQTGDTDVSGFRIEGHQAIPERELTAAMADADVVVAHAGVGASLAAFEVGKCPVLVPRRLSPASTSTTTRSRSRPSSAGAASRSQSKPTS